MNKAIELLKEKRAELISAKKYNDRIRKEQTKAIKEWESQGLDQMIIAGRCIRFFGDPVQYDKQLHKDINALLKYLKAEDFEI